MLEIKKKLFVQETHEKHEKNYYLATYGNSFIGNLRRDGVFSPVPNVLVLPLPHYMTGSWSFQVRFPKLELGNERS